MSKKDFKKTAAEIFISGAGEPQEAQEAPAGPQEDKRAERTGKPVQTKSERLQLLIRPTTKKALQAEAARRHVSVNELINSILEEHLQG